jgi:hypothetical protein
MSTKATSRNTNSGTENHHMQHDNEDDRFGGEKLEPIYQVGF